MIDYILFWLSKSAAEFLIAIALIALCLLIGFISIGIQMIKQKMCKHTDYYENGMNLHIYCRKCKKDLGFTGTFHENKNK